jgi:hypothetical protein
VDCPSLIEWTEHARVKAERERFVLTDIEDAVLGHHEHRARNPRQADWVLRVGRLVVVYDWPANGDAVRARVISVWRAPR